MFDLKKMFEDTLGKLAPRTSSRPAQTVSVKKPTTPAQTLTVKSAPTQTLSMASPTTQTIQQPKMSLQANSYSLNNVAKPKLQQTQVSPQATQRLSTMPSTATLKAPVATTPDELRRNRAYQSFKLGKSFEDISKDSGLSTREVQDMQKTQFPTYGDKGVVQNVANATGKFVGDTAKLASGIVTRPFTDLNDLDRKKGEAELQQINKDYRSGAISPDAAMERAQKLASSYTTQKAYQDDQGNIRVGKQNPLEFAGNIVDQGNASSSVIPVTGGLLSGASQAARLTGKTAMANTLQKGATLLTGGASTPATSRLAQTLTNRGVNPTTAGIVGNAVTSNARQTLVTGTAATGADIVNNRGISPESLALNYGADFAMGTIPELGLGLGTQGIRAGIDAVPTAQKLTLANPEIQGIKADIDKLFEHKNALLSRGLSPNNAAVVQVDNAIKAAGAEYNRVYKEVYAQAQEKMLAPLVKANEFTKQHLIPGGTLGGPLAADFSKAKAAGQVFDGVDGKPRFEVDDSGAKIKNPNGATLGEVLDHPALYKNYPDLKNIKTSPTMRGGVAGDGRYNPKNNTLEFNPNAIPDKLKGTILHEVQHGIQNKEGFASGSAPRDFLKKRTPAEDQELFNLYAKHDNGGLTKIEQKRFEALKGIDPLEGYRRTAGEAEARAVQARMNMPMSERYVKPEGETLYHGTTEKWQGDEPRFPLYTTPNKNYAQVYADSTAASSIAKSGVKQADGSKVREFKLNPKARVLDATDPKVRKMLDEEYFGKWSMSDKFYPGKNGHLDWTEGENLAEFIAEKKLPYDAIKLDEGGGGLDPQFGVMVDDKGTSVLALNKNAISPNKPRSTFYDSLDVPKEDLIIRNGDGKAMSIDDPIAALKREALSPQAQKLYDTAKDMSDSEIADTLRGLTGYENTPAYQAFKRLSDERTTTNSTGNMIVGSKEWNDYHAREAVKKEAQDLATTQRQATQRKDLQGFTDNMSQLQAGKAAKTLDSQIRYNGEVMPKREYIRKLINDGFIPDEKLNQIADPNMKGAYQVVTKTEADYARHLYNQAHSKPAPKVEAPQVTKTEPTTVYHGKSVGGGETGDRLGRGLYVTTDKNRASGYAKGGAIDEYSLDGVKLANLDDKIDSKIVDTLKKEINDSIKRGDNSYKDTIRLSVGEKKFSGSDVVSARQFRDEQKAIATKLGLGEDSMPTVRKDSNGDFTVTYVDSTLESLKNIDGNRLFQSLPSPDAQRLFTSAGYDGVSSRAIGGDVESVIYNGNLKKANTTVAPQVTKTPKQPSPFQQDLQQAGIVPKTTTEKQPVQANSKRLPADELVIRNLQDSAEHKARQNVPAPEDIAAPFSPNKTDRQKAAQAKFEAATKEYLGNQKSASFDKQSRIADLNKKFKLTKEEQLNATLSIDNPNIKPMNDTVAAYNKEFKRLTDEAYTYYTKQKDFKMGYQQDYLPRNYKHPETGAPITAQEYNLLTTGSSRSKARTAEEVNVDALVSTNPTDLLSRYYTSMDNATAGRRYLNKLEAQGLVVRASEPPRGLKPIVAEGLQAGGGMVYYAQKNVADKLNRLFGDNSPEGIVGIGMSGLAKANNFMQQIVLSGGAPNTPINAFGIMQVMKETMAGHPIKAAKAFAKGFSKRSADKFFESKKNIMKLMAENDVAPRLNLEQSAKNGRQRIVDAGEIAKTQGKNKAGQIASQVNQAWDEITNDSTFNRFMPALEVMHFEQVYNKALKTHSKAEAAAIAAKSVKNFYGRTSDYKQTMRTRLANDTSGALLFAPRFREAMVNFWGKNIQMFSPKGGFKNIRSLEYRDNLKFMVTAGVLYAGMDALNYALNGVNVWDNPNDKQDKLIIPADKLKQIGIDTQGKDVGAPYLSSIATVPRNAIGFVSNLAKGDTEGATKNASSFLSMPLKTTGELASNQDYFGSPITTDDMSTGQKYGAMASYVAKNNMQPWLREGMNLTLQNAPDDVKKSLGVKDKSTVETVSNALEAPFRFYNPAYYRYSQGQNTANNKNVGDTTSIDSLTKANEDRAAAFKKSFSTEDWKLYNLSNKDRQKLVSNGTYTQAKVDGLMNYATNKKKELGYDTTSTSSTSIAKNISQSSKNVLTKYSDMTASERTQWFSSQNDAELQYELAKYENDKANGSVSSIQDVSRVKSLMKDKIGSSYSKDTRDLYSLSKSDIYNYVTKNANGKKLADELIAYDKALYDAGLVSYRKFKNGTTTASSSSSSRSSSRKTSSKGKFDYKLNGFASTSGSGSSASAKDFYDLLKKAKLA